ncbi:MAG: efflux RND transporter periplasmic adaptor subunit [Rikenellaceae bacterium]|nr:efflux RND transporter periplasmic adaptor subunit [Rikenellaceae bacterium]
MKKKMLFALCAIVVAVVLSLAFCKGDKPRPVDYETYTVEPVTIANSVTATGTVEPIVKVEVGTQVSGIISKLYVDYNSEVKAGQLIAELDRSLLAAEVASSQANLQANKVELDYQQANYDRIKGLHQKGLVSASEYEQAEYQYGRARSSYDAAKISAERAVINLGYCSIYSPIDGVVLSRAVDEGQTVASGYSTPTLFTIANDLRNMRVIADVDEADIGEVEPGQAVSFTVDAYIDRVFQGTVTEVRLEATTTSNVVTYEVVIDAPNPDLKLKPGLTANVTISTLSKEHILAVPARALRFTPEYLSDREVAALPAHRVWMQKEDGQLAMVAVETGISDGISTEVTSGLEEGAQVVVGEKITLPELSDQNQSGLRFGPGRRENKRTR